MNNKLAEREQGRRAQQHKKRSRRPELIDSVALPPPNDLTPQTQEAHVLANPQPPRYFKPLAARRRTAAKLLDVGTSKIDELIATNQIEARKSGKVLLIVYTSIERYLANLPRAVLALPARLRKGARDSNDA